MDSGHWKEHCPFFISALLHSPFSAVLHLAGWQQHWPLILMQGSWGCDLKEDVSLRAVLVGSEMHPGSFGKCLYVKDFGTRKP